MRTVQALPTWLIDEITQTKGFISQVAVEKSIWLHNSPEDVHRLWFFIDNPHSAPEEVLFRPENVKATVYCVHPLRRCQKKTKDVANKFNHKWGGSTDCFPAKHQCHFRQNSVSIEKYFSGLWNGRLCAVVLWKTLVVFNISPTRRKSLKKKSILTLINSTLRGGQIC